MNTVLKPNQQPSENAPKAAESASGNAQLENGALQAQVVQIDTLDGATGVLEGMSGNEVREAQDISQKQQNDPAGQQQSTRGEDSNLANALLPEMTELPAPAIMTRKVRVSISQEIKTLEQQVHKLRKNAVKLAYELAKAFDALRHLKNLLSHIATFAVEFLQMLFQKVLKKESLATVEC